MNSRNRSRPKTWAALASAAILACAPILNAADTTEAVRPQPRTDPNSRIAHEQLLEKAKKGRIDVYFIGDSITRRWGATDPQYNHLLKHWKESFFGWNAANFAWGGDRIENILWRLQNGELEGVRPKVFVVQAGANNVGSNPQRADKPERIAAGIKQVIDLCRKQAPESTIVLTAIFPRNDNMEVMPVIKKANELIANLADGKSVRFININREIANEAGKFRAGFVDRDQLHPSLKTYEVWAEALKPIFTEILGAPASTDQAPPPTGDPSAVRK